MSLQENKKNRLNDLLLSIVEADKKGINIDKEKLIAECVIKYGSARRTILEYLSVLENAGRIVIKNNHVFSKEGWEAEKILNRAGLNKECQTKTTSKEEEKNTTSAKN